MPVSALRPVPDGLGTDAAVALIGTGRTAVAVLEHAALTPDDVVVVTAAAGGLGTLFVQAARHLGATVVGLAGGPDKVARVEALGADVAVDYGQPGWARRGAPTADGRADARPRRGGRRARTGGVRPPRAGRAHRAVRMVIGHRHAVHVRRPGRPRASARRGRSARR